MIFTAVKYCCILHGRVCVMEMRAVLATYMSDKILVLSVPVTGHCLSFTIHVIMSLVVRKPVFGVSDQVPHKPGCTATEDV